MKIVITTCGGRYNEDFLDKQKTILSLANVVVSNGIGTNIGYAVYMKKPYIIFRENMKLIGEEKVIKETKILSKEVNNENFIKTEKEYIYGLFSKIDDTLTKEQYDFCEYYWGFSKIKTPSEILVIFDKCKEHYQQFYH